LAHRGMHGLQCIYHEINSQLIFLNFQAGFGGYCLRTIMCHVDAYCIFGGYHFNSYISYFLYACFAHILYIVHSVGDRGIT